MAIFASFSQCYCKKNKKTLKISENTDQNPNITDG